MKEEISKDEIDQDKGGKQKGRKLRQINEGKTTDYDEGENLMIRAYACLLMLVTRSRKSQRIS